MLSQYNTDTKSYEDAKPKQPKQENAPYNPQQGAPNDTSQLGSGGAPTSGYGGLWNDWRAPYQEILAGMQQGGGGGGGEDTKRREVKKIELSPFDQQYTDFRTLGYKNTQDLMTNPQGYSPEELAIVQGQALDKLYATAAGARMQAKDQANKGGYLNTGVGQQMMAAPDQQLLGLSGDALRAIALQDLENKRQGRYAANAAMQSWTGQMGGEQAQQQGAKYGVESDFQNRLDAEQARIDAERARAAAAAYGRQDDIMNMQMRIASKGQEQEMYDNDYILQLLAAQQGWGNNAADLEWQSYQSNPNYTGNRNPWGGG